MIARVTGDLEKCALPKVVQSELDAADKVLLHPPDCIAGAKLVAFGHVLVDGVGDEVAEEGQKDDWNVGVPLHDVRQAHHVLPVFLNALVGDIQIEHVATFNVAVIDLFLDMPIACGPYRDGLAGAAYDFRLDGEMLRSARAKVL